MQFDKKKYVFLNKIIDNEPLFPPRPGKTSIGLYPQNKDKVLANEVWYDKIFMPLASEIRTLKNITYVSDSVREVFDNDIKVADKLWNLRDEVMPEIGMLLMSGGQSYLYFIHNDREKKSVTVSVFVASKDIWMSYSMVWWDYGVRGIKINEDYSFDCMANEPNYNVSFPAQTVVTFLLFKEYAELETKIIQKGREPRVVLNNEKYVTDLDLPIKIIDSTWFTTLIKSDSFKVSGHFRLQPYGEGLKQKKLIWISEYQKDGIIREAKMLKAKE
ncbi:MAG: hypothetical protein QM541_15230 [Flavobacterium sp.]|nr:hypothetical protein [Flavobacterium sp.]